MEISGSVEHVERATVVFEYETRVAFVAIKLGVTRFDVAILNMFKCKCDSSGQRTTF